jgi:hypothetical protein
MMMGSKNHAVLAGMRRRTSDDGDGAGLSQLCGQQRCSELRIVFPAIPSAHLHLGDMHTHITLF